MNLLGSGERGTYTQASAVNRVADCQLVLVLAVTNRSIDVPPFNRTADWSPVNNVAPRFGWVGLPAAPAIPGCVLNRGRCAPSTSVTTVAVSTAFAMLRIRASLSTEVPVTVSRRYHITGASAATTAV